MRHSDYMMKMLQIRAVSRSIWSHIGVSENRRVISPVSYEFRYAQGFLSLYFPKSRATCTTKREDSAIDWWAVFKQYISLCLNKIFYDSLAEISDQTVHLPPESHLSLPVNRRYKIQVCTFESCVSHTGTTYVSLLSGSIFNALHKPGSCTTQKCMDVTSTFALLVLPVKTIRPTVQRVFISSLLSWADEAYVVVLHNYACKQCVLNVCTIILTLCQTLSTNSIRLVCCDDPMT